MLSDNYVPCGLAPSTWRAAQGNALLGGDGGCARNAQGLPQQEEMDYYLV